MLPSNTPAQDAHQRLQKWSPFFLRASSDMFKLARRHRENNEYISAYLCLWVAFNNLYSLLTKFSQEEEKRMIEEAIRALPELKINQFLSDREYVTRFHCLNNRQIREAPDFCGLMNMRSFFKGRPLGQCVERLTLDVPPESGSLTAKQDFFFQLGARLLYTARNNLFHAVKDPDDPDSPMNRIVSGSCTTRSPLPA